MGINNSGEIVGYYTDSSGNQHGFIYQSGTFTTVDDPDGTDTHLTAINNNGEIAGYYQSPGPSGIPVTNGLIYDNGTFTTLTL
jgi:probable HAF family extracellular repeat protein